MLSIYPDFKKLEIEDKEDIENITNNFPPYSDFNFVSLYSYDTEVDALISNLNGNLVIKFRDYITNEPFYSFLGNMKVTETAHELLKRANNEGAMQKLQLIPQSVIDADIKILEEFEVIEDPNNYDYVLDVPEISTLEGEKYHNKRHAVNRFNSESPNYEVVNLNLNDQQTKEEVIELFLVWATSRNKKEEEYIHELKAVKRLLAISHKLNLLAIGIYINKVMVGFAIAEILENDYAIFHFVKANLAHKGIFESLYMLKAKELLKNNRKYWNIEQDLGIESLRHTKQQWNPSHYLKKYIITERK